MSTTSFTTSSTETFNATAEPVLHMVTESSTAATIVAVVTGCLLLLLLAALVVTKQRKRRARDRAEASAEPEPDYLLNDPFISDRFGYTHLHYAIIQRDAKQFQILLNTKLASLQGEPAAKRLSGHPSQLLTQVLNSKDGVGNTLLMWAIRVQHIDMVRILLTAGAPINERNNTMRTALHVAAFEDVSLELVKLLLSFNPTSDMVDMHGDTPLLLAARCGAAHVAQALLKSGADMNSQDAQRVTPLMLAASLDHPAIVAMLINKRATKVNAQDDNGWSAFHWAAACGCLEATQLLLTARKPTLYMLNKQGETPLHLAAREGSVDVVKVLTMQRDNGLVLPLVQHVSSNGQTPIDVARERNHFQIANFLAQWLAYATRSSNNDGLELEQALRAMLAGDELSRSPSPESERVVSTVNDICYNSNNETVKLGHGGPLIHRTQEGARRAFRRNNGPDTTAVPRSPLSVVSPSSSDTSGASQTNLLETDAMIQIGLPRRTNSNESMVDLDEVVHQAEAQPYTSTPPSLALSPASVALSEQLASGVSPHFVEAGPPIYETARRTALNAVAITPVSEAESQGVLPPPRPSLDSGMGSGTALFTPSHSAHAQRLAHSMAQHGGGMAPPKHGADAPVELQPLEHDGRQRPRNPPRPARGTPLAAGGSPYNTLASRGGTLAWSNGLPSIDTLMRVNGDSPGNATMLYDRPGHVQTTLGRSVKLMRPLPRDEKITQFRQSNERLVTDLTMQHKQAHALSAMADETALFTSPDGTLVSMRSSRNSTLSREDRMSLSSKTSTADSNGILSALPSRTQHASSSVDGLRQGAANEVLFRRSGESDHDVWEMGKPKGSRNSVGVWLAEADSRQVLLA
eukprot:m.140110 g.140110  ORF g.140110 m.140110 type:complete len:861 (+) comp16102_c0_seq3:166-2748(+)